MISWNITFKTKFLLSVLLVFSGIMDVLLGELILHRSIGLAPILLVLAFLFILQDRFQWVRTGFLILIGALVLYRLWEILLNSFTILENMYRAFTQPAVIPLFISLLLIGLLSFLFFKTDVIVQRRHRGES